jgi:uncharacterized LabA/DUF88 family protein
VAVGEASRLAVLIDADNASAGVVKELLEEVAMYGTATVKRAYGDWTTQNLVGWKDQLHRHAIQPVQQFGYTKGKNSTDAAFITDAMDLLYAGSVDGFCIVASDSDYTRLSANLPPLAALARQVGRVAVSQPTAANRASASPSTSLHNIHCALSIVVQTRRGRALIRLGLVGHLTIERPADAAVQALEPLRAFERALQRERIDQHVERAGDSWAMSKRRRHEHFSCGHGP